MRGAFRDLPIRLKLTAIIMTTVLAVLALSSLGYLLVDFYQTRIEMDADLDAQARLILQNSDAPLRFDDVRAANDTLQTLAGKQNIRLACLFDEDGALFVSYRRPGEPAECPPRAGHEDGVTLSRLGLELWMTGVLDRAKFGSLMIRSDLDVLIQRARAQLLVVALLLLAGTALAIFLSSRLQAVVSEPVMALASTASEVTRRGDYSLRATRSTGDELGDLVDAFNRMLATIETREVELSRANEDLRREVAERRKAEQERAELLVREREANRLKDEFLATLSHELRTPLNAILGWTKLLRAGALPAGTADRALEKVERNAQVQSRLIEDLLEVSRIVTGKLRLDYKRIDLVPICLTAVDSLRPAAEARGVSMHVDLPPGAMPTTGDPDRLQQVVWNLLSNAVKFTPSGGRVTLALRREEGTDVITVADTGIGIDAEFLPSVFETFRQADASSTRAYGGLGLGLSIVKQLVDLHGGEVQARSDGKDLGSTFTVRLPVRAPERRRQDDHVLEAPQPPGRPLAGRDILVVDDDPDTLELLVTVLQEAGGVVRPAASAAHAVALSLDRAPDAIISDLAMPGEDGYALMTHLVQTLGPAAPRVRIALSAFAAPQDRDRALAAGFHQHVPKPVDPIALVRLLDEMLVKA